MVATLEVHAIPATTQLALLREFGPVWRVQHCQTLEVWVVRAWAALDAAELVGYPLSAVVVIADGYNGFVDNIPTRIAAPFWDRPWPVEMVPVRNKPRYD